MQLVFTETVTAKLDQYTALCAAQPAASCCLAVRWFKPLSGRDPALAALSEGIETLTVGRATVQPEWVLIGDPDPNPPVRQDNALSHFSAAIPRGRIIDVRIFATMAAVTSKELFAFMMGTTTEPEPAR